MGGWVGDERTGIFLDTQRAKVLMELLLPGRAAEAGRGRRDGPQAREHPRPLRVLRADLRGFLPRFHPSLVRSQYLLQKIEGLIV